ncbi:hypothetical protein P7K49_012958, partial [Saguinus oedipus]
TRAPGAFANRRRGVRTLDGSGVTTSVTLADQKTVERHGCGFSSCHCLSHGHQKVPPLSSSSGEMAPELAGNLLDAEHRARKAEASPHTQLV